MVNQFTQWVTPLQARLHAFPAPWLRCSFSQNAVCSVVAPSQKSGKTHTRTCPTTISRITPGLQMPLPIEEYALIGDCHTAALVGRDGSIDWLCLPRFDSGAYFAALLGDPEHGRWLLAPAAQALGVRRSYRDGTLILETEFETKEGAVRIIDWMPLSDQRWDVVRIVEGLRGTVPMRMELVIRFDYGSIVPGCGARATSCWRPPGRIRWNCALRSQCAAKT